MEEGCLAALSGLPRKVYAKTRRDRMTHFLDRTGLDWLKNSCWGVQGVEER